MKRPKTYKEPIFASENRQGKSKKCYELESVEWFPLVNINYTVCLKQIANRHASVTKEESEERKEKIWRSDSYFQKMKQNLTEC